MSELVLASREGRVMRVALNRPEKRNALNHELCRELVNVLHSAADDPGIGAILLEANGKSFCAGMDLNEVLTAEAEKLGEIHEQLFTAGSRLAKPIVAAVHGAALAGGTGLAANCRVVIASEDATFGLTEIRLGLWPFLIFRAVAAAIGERRTVELSLTGRIFGAAEAREYGLVSQVVPTGELASRAAEVAASIANASPTAVGSGLSFVREIRGRSGKSSGAIAHAYREQLFRSPDFAEGVRAFLEKREPKWPSLHNM